MSQLPEDSIILAKHCYRCIVCSRPCVAIHEIEPRSRRPQDWSEEANRVPLCAACHARVHMDGAATWADRLRTLRDQSYAKHDKSDCAGEAKLQRKL